MIASDLTVSCILGTVRFNGHSNITEKERENPNNNSDTPIYLMVKLLTVGLFTPIISLNT